MAGVKIATFLCAVLHAALFLEHGPERVRVVPGAGARKLRLYLLQPGLDGRLVKDASTGSRTFRREAGSGF